jgi:hypothetical protein
MTSTQDQKPLKLSSKEGKSFLQNIINKIKETHAARGKRGGVA